ncbi:MAG: NapC/NirT family cytochrome c [Anaerolineae bacterium]|nr:NapC/NirT family cytochrome c [Anaerolineae bacterium]
MRKIIGWFAGLRWPVRWLVAVLTVIVLFLLAVTVSATTWEYTNSPEFCGTVCHTMPPEYTAYQISPHARVDCVDCHLGRDSILLTVPRKAREVTHVINALTQAYEPPIYVKNLRPARDTCERCHNPDKFSSDTFVQIKRYADDEPNSQQSIFLILKTGGGTRREGLGRGIHWHIENEVWYYTDDPLKQTIPYVKEVGPEGQVVEYLDVEAGLPPDFGREVADKLQRMDCIDCHNRISHLFRSPADAIDQALARQQIEATIPAIKEQGIRVLSQQFPSTAEGLKSIAALEGWYQENYPDFYSQHKEPVQKAVAALQEIFTVTVFPNMGVGWQTHPNNLGHKEFPGCFRCHDGKHTSPTGQTVRLECNICHSIPEIVDDKTKRAPLISIDKPDEPDSHRDSNWLARHRYQFDETCAECHDISNPGGADNSSFCANSGCHATEWKFVGLDAPAIRALVEPPPVPGSGEPRPVPHPVGPRTDCAICHDAESVRPVPAEHPGYEQSLCTLCHQPTLTDKPGEAVAKISVPDIPHRVEGQEEKCLTCHEPDAVSPFPQSHVEWPTETCLFCHQAAAITETEDEEGRPKIPHTLEGREDCLLCHSLDSIKPFPANHENRSVEKCQNCHKPEIGD